MNALRVWDAADDFVRIRVQHDNLGGVRDVDAAGVAVDIDVVPAAFTADGNGLDHFIPGRAGAAEAASKIAPVKIAATRAAAAARIVMRL